jgi:hypothetical protein
MKTVTSPPESLNTLDEWLIVNVEGLRRSLARTRTALLSVSLVLVGWIVGPPLARRMGVLPTEAAGGEVRARRFVLTGADDRIRGTWGVDESGVTRLLLRDDAGVPRLRISVLENGSPGMAFTDEVGHSRVVLGLLADGSSSLVFADPSGATRAVLGISADEGTTLVFADPAGPTPAGLGVDPRGRPTFLMDDDQSMSASAGGR